MRQKIRRLRLEVDGDAKKNRAPSSSGLKLPADLPSVEEALKDLVAAKTPLSVIAKKLGVSEESARAKIQRLGLEEVEQRKNACSSSSELIMPEELISLEDALKKLVASMTALETPGLSKTEIMRLRSLIQTSSLYQKRIAEYMDYRGTEKWLIALEEKYDGVVKRQKEQMVAPPS